MSGMVNLLEVVTHLIKAVIEGRPQTSKSNSRQSVSNFSEIPASLPNNRTQPSYMTAIHMTHARSDYVTNRRTSLVHVQPNASSRDG